MLAWDRSLARTYVIRAPPCTEGPYPRGSVMGEDSRLGRRKAADVGFPIGSGVELLGGGKGVR